MDVLMGANGNITSRLAKLLLGQGRKVRVIGRDAAHMKSLKDAGAELAVGSAADAARQFLFNLSEKRHEKDRTGFAVGGARRLRRVGG